MTAPPTMPRKDRLRVMEKALVEGVSIDDLAQSAPAQFQISKRQALRDLRHLQHRLAAEGAEINGHPSDPRALAVAVKRRERIYQEAVKSGDRRVALEAEKDRCRLLGVYPSSEADELADVEVREIDRAIEAELARLAAGGQVADAAKASPPHGAAAGGVESEPVVGQVPAALLSPAAQPSAPLAR